MGQVTMALPPPKLWQQFEELTRDVAEVIFSDPGARNYGNQGASQNGVDVYCRENRNGRMIGIQCKRYGTISASGSRGSRGLTAGDVRTEVNNAKSFSQTLDHYVIATTDTRQTSIQDEVIRINAQHAQANLFTVDLWFWDDFLGYLHKYSDLLQWYYDNVLELKGVYSFEHQILYLLQMAFSRPAFTTPLLAEEGSSELFDALRDTEMALNTGQLKDRETKSILRVAPGGIGLIVNPRWAGGVQAVSRIVKEVRSKYRKAKRDGLLIELSDRIEVRDANVAQEIDKLRGDAIRELNSVLVDAGLTEVESTL